MRVLLAQLAPEIANVKGNVSKVLEVLERYDSDVYVFPELFLTGYNVGDEIITLAEEIPEALDIIREHAGDRLVIVGGPEKASEGRIFNAAFAIGGAEHVYRKHFLPNHLPFTEKLWFHPGYGEETFEYKGRRIGLMVCYDVFFPEIARRYAVQDVELLITISASPFGRSVYFDTFTVARAIESGAFHVYVNRVGVEGPLNFWGGSRVVSPDGSVLVSLPRLHETDKVEAVRVAEIDKKELRYARLSAPLIRDLRFSPRYSMWKNIKF